MIQQTRPVVVINDSPELLALIGEVLREGEGYAVRTFRAEGVGLEQVVAERPALVIIDLLLPATGEQLSGWELLEAILDEPRLVSVPIVATSAAIEAFREHEAALERRENVATLLKPFSIRELTTIVDRLIPG